MFYHKIYASKLCSMLLIYTAGIVFGALVVVSTPQKRSYHVADQNSLARRHVDKLPLHRVNSDFGIRGTPHVHISEEML